MKTVYLLMSPGDYDFAPEVVCVFESKELADAALEKCGGLNSINQIEECELHDSVPEMSVWYSVEKNYLKDGSPDPFLHYESGQLVEQCEYRISAQGWIAGSDDTTRERSVVLSQCGTQTNKWMEIKVECESLDTCKAVHQHYSDKMKSFAADSGIVSLPWPEGIS